MTSPLGTVTYTYDAADQLLTAGMLTFAYDANGNQVRRSDARGTYTLAYNDGDHLTQITAPGGVTTTYRYDPTGRRISLQGRRAPTEFIYDGMAVILEGNAGMTQGTAYLWARGNLAAARPLGEAGSAVGYLGDRLGSVMHTTDAAGSFRAPTATTPLGMSRQHRQVLPIPTALWVSWGCAPSRRSATCYLMGLRYYDAAPAVSSPGSCSRQGRPARRRSTAMSMR